MIRVLSLFSGCGGFDLGFSLEGYKTVWANDFEHWSCESFRANFGDIIREGDIAEIDPADPSIPDCDLIIGGFPCQDFSVLKDRPGLKTKRGSLFHYFADFVEAKKPLAFVIENVQGILTANGGNALDAILERFEDIEPGYIIKPKLYDFSQYGVPQFRKRVLFVGVRVDTGFDFKHPEPRPLTNRERARLQSFPDDFIFCGPLAEVRRQIGNAVPPKGVRPVAAALRPLFTGEYKRVSLEEKLQWLRIRASKSRVQ